MRVECLKMEKRLLIMTNKRFLSCWFHVTARGSRITDKSLKHVSPMYVTIALLYRRAAQKYCSLESSKAMAFTLELKENWKRRKKKGKNIRTRRGDENMFVPLIPFKNGSWTRCVHSHWIVLNSSCMVLRGLKQVDSSAVLYIQKACFSQVIEIIWNNSMLKGRVTQSLADYCRSEKPSA